MLSMAKNKPWYFLLLVLLSGGLFWLGWPTKPLTFIVFFAFVPILIIEDTISKSSVKRKAGKFLFYAYLALLCWNVFTTYWVYNSTPIGGIFAMVANALLMCIPLLLFHFVKRSTNIIIGLFSFIVFWISFEYIHLNWELTWPWLTLGNSFASLRAVAQWYEYTGALGGSLWILVMNVLIFLLISRISILKEKKWFGKLIIVIVLLAVIPTLISLFIYSNYKEQGEDVEVVVVQPNIDPFNEKFEGGKNFIPYDRQLERLLALSEHKITPATAYLVWPETALPFGYMETQMEGYEVITALKRFVARHQGMSLITGMDSYRIYQTKETPSSSLIQGTGYYDGFNTAMQINDKGVISLYHKSKLVPGVEYVPPALNAFIINMGGGSGVLGTQKDRTLFFNGAKTGVAPVICYESIFGDFVTQYIRNGAELIFIITNDGWWGNTQGHKQHLQYGCLRAIETRRSIARAANTGISGFINQRGDIVEQSEYWLQDVMRRTIKQNKVITFYVRYGDYIGRAALYLSLVVLVAAVIFKLRKKNVA